MDVNSARTDTVHASREIPAVIDIVEQLRRMIVHELDVRIKVESVTDEVPLLETGLGLDSIVLYEFITLIEKRYGFEFADQSLHPDLFANLTVLAKHIYLVMASHKQAAAS